MTESGTDSTTLTWSVPQCPFTIEASSRVMDDIRLAVTDAFFSLPRGGAEIGGILLGTFENGRLVISDYAALDCEHAYGPSFVLSPPDEARLAAMLSAQAGRTGGCRPVGWYHSHTRTEIFLSDGDLALHKRFFPESWQVALVMKPHTFQPARIGFFFRQADGSIQANASCREDTLEALPMRQMPPGTPPVASWDDPPPRNPHPAPVPSPVLEPKAALSPAAAEPAQPLPDAAVADLPVPKFVVESESSARRWMAAGIGIVAVLGIAGAAYQVRQMWLPQVLAAIRPAAPPASTAPVSLGLRTIDHEGQLQIQWDRSSSAVRRATDAILEITDGGPLPVANQIDTAHLETGSFTYARTSEKVDVLLIVHQKDGPDVREVTSFLGKLPSRKTVEEQEAEQKQREEAAQQAAKMKADLTFQAAKTKKLEQEVETMREELRQQQQRRLNNQIPDK
jgi:proteasome lid subunit RPN8/RPN11